MNRSANRPIYIVVCCIDSMKNNSLTELLATKNPFLKKPSVYGNVLDRYLFNFRIDLEKLENHMPSLRWLVPRNVNGYGVVSLCLVNFKGLTVWPLPKALGINTVTCAYRYSVIDMSKPEPSPSVYLLGRNTDNSFVNYFGPQILSSKVGQITSSIKKDKNGDLNIDLGFSDKKMMFSATVLQAKYSNKQNSLLFESEEDFEKFMENGKSSYTPATSDGKYSRLDLETKPYRYEQVNARINVNSLADDWDDADLVFDSAYRALGKKQYKINNMGLYNGGPQFIRSKVIIHG